MNKKEVMQLEETVIAKTFNRFPVVFHKGEGTRLWDDEGKEYLDFFSGHAVMSLGYNYPEQMKAMQQQLKQLVHTGNLYYLQPQVELAQLIIKHSFGDKVLFSNSGAEIIELAIKLARKWARSSEPKDDRYEILTVRGSFHGRTYGAITATGQDKLHQGIGPMLPGFKYVYRDDFTSVAAAITNKTCAIMLEPVQGEGGIHPADKIYLEKLRDLCNRNKLLLVFDEIQCGLGRTGSINAYEHYGVIPDIMLLAKPLGGGLPLSALVTTNKIASALNVGDHGSTFGGNPVAASAGIVLYKVLTKTGFLEKVIMQGEYLEEKLKQLSDKYSTLVIDVRGVGLMRGMEVKEHGPEIVKKALELGLVINCTAGQVLRFLPALTVTRQAIDSMIKILDKVLKSFK